MRNSWGLLVVFAVLIVGAIAIAWAAWLFGIPVRREDNLVEVLEVNNRGVAYMERYSYEEAEKQFREIVAKRPDWIPGRINLAISLLNQNKPETLAEAEAILRQVLCDDPDNPYGHYSLAVILNQSGNAEAAEHFEAVTRIDPADPHAWYYLAKTREIDDAEAAKAYMEKAAALHPNLSSAIYGLAMQQIRAGRREEGQKLLQRHQQLVEAKWDEKADIKYGFMGQYADVIGRTKNRATRTGPVPLFQPVDSLEVKLAAGTRWATDDDFQGDDVTALRGRIRKRFGVVHGMFDYDADGRTDLLFIGAVVRDDAVGDLLLRNLGDWKFEDVTAEANLADARPSLGCAIGDVDNDGQPDLYIAGAGRNYLFRNDAGKFVEFDMAVGTQPMITLGGMFVDLDQDGDLDLYSVNYASMGDADTAFAGEMPAPASNQVYRNDGKARTVAADKASETGGAPLEIAFTPFASSDELVHGTHTVSLAAADFDNDRDIDLCLVSDRAAPVLVLNERLMQFRRQEIASDVLPAAPYNGAVAADFDKNGIPDLWFANSQGRCALLLGQTKTEAGLQFTLGATNAEKMTHGRLIDLDLDGWFDVAGLFDGNSAVAHNETTRLTLRAGAFGFDDNAGVVASIVSDFDGNGPADILRLGPEGLAAARNLGNGHHWLKLKLTGMRDVGKEMRTSRDAIAARYVLHAKDLWIEGDQADQVAGLGSIHEPVLLGLGDRTAVDALRVRWPDGTLQAELGGPIDSTVTVGQEQRKPISCPLLFTWNGRRFEYIADFLGGGGLGYLLAPGVYNEPDRDEAVKIEPGKLVPNDGRYVLKIAEPMDEVTYLDHVTLVAIDHPADLHVHPDERFAAVGHRPEWKLHAYRQPILPARVIDSYGLDVSDRLATWDRRTADNFKLRGAWIGYAEPHSITLDFADRLSQFDSDTPLVMYLAGWVEYPFSETNYAAATAGVALEPPVVERQNERGEWQTIFPAAGHPAGSPKMMTLDVTGKLTGPTCVLRIRTNMQVYWDQIFVAPAESADQYRVNELHVIDAELAYRGHLTEFSPDGQGPTEHDYHRVDPVPLVRQQGRLTRFGDVKELLLADDDRSVLFAAGDEVTVDFDANALPPVPDGWQRSFVLRTWGYCKSADVLTLSGDTIEPLPFRGMKSYPPAAQDQPLDPDAFREYQATFNTR